METCPLVIVNPASRGGAGARDWPRAAVAVRAQLGPFECRFTEGPGDAERLARAAAEAGRKTVLTFGGDGTISEASRGILASGRPAALGILPHGTGGDLARSLSIPSRIADAARALRSARAVSIDVGRVVLSDGLERTFLNAASFGLSADVAERLGRSRASVTGRASYARHALEAAMALEPASVVLEADARPRRRLRITTVSVHNGRFFGGGMEMAPGASVTDGSLEAVVVKKMRLSTLLAKAPLLYWGSHLHLDEVEHGPVRRLLAWPGEASTRVPLEIDGETGFALPARFEVVPGALRVLLPRRAC